MDVNSNAKKLAYIFSSIFIIVIFLLANSIKDTTAQSDERLRQKCLSYQEQFPERNLPDLCDPYVNGGGDTDPTPTPDPEPNPDPAEPNPEPDPQPNPDPEDEFEYCDDHSTTEFHTLYNEDDDCWYNHEHGDDPNEMNDVFGPVSSWWGGTQEISYPWQTYGFEGSSSGQGDDYPTKTGLYENEGKHNGYKWYTREFDNCESRYTEGCVVAVRTAVHGIGAAAGAVTRFHSFVTELIACPLDEPNNCGTIKTGGWQDKGPLAIDNQIYEEFGPNLPSNGTRLHYENEGDPKYATWYGGSKLASTVQQFEDMWGYVHAENPRVEDFFCPEDPANCGQNSSKRQLHIAGAGIPGREVAWLNQNGYMDSDGRVDFQGFTDRYGNIIRDDSCEVAGLDCVPLILDNFDVSILYQVRDSTVIEYDESIGVLDSSPIRYPN